MRKFAPDLFNELAFLPENGLMDRKSQLYRVYGQNILKSRSDLVKDMIALANTARRRGKPAYLFLGVQDKTSVPEDQLPGIDGQCNRPTKPQGWDNLSIEEQQERIGKDYQRIIREYVTPPMDFEYLWGYVDGKLVSYILVAYNPHERPFEIKKEVASKEKVFLKRGDCWERIGESNESVSPHEKQYLYRYNDVPYITKKAWETHVKRCLEAYRSDIDPEISLKVLKVSPSKRIDWNEQINQWIDSQAHHIVLLIGGPGTGKTTTLRQTMYILSSNLLANLEAIGSEEQPSEPIPVYVDLNERSFDGSKAFKRELVSRLDEFGCLELRNHPQPYTFFGQGKRRFVILLDGLDEIESTNGRQTRAAIRGVIDSSPLSMHFIVAGRTIGMPPSWLNRYPVFQIEPVEQPSIREFLDGTLEVGSEAWDFIYGDGLLQLVSSPLAMNAFKEQWLQWEQDYREYQDQRIQGEDVIRPDPPTVAGVIETILTKLLHHDIDKGTLKDESMLYERLTRLGKLALWLKVRGQETTSVSQAKEILGEAVYGYGCQLQLLKVQDDGQVCLGSSLLFDYFAVYRLKELLEHSAGASSMTWERCGRMLDSLIADLLPLLIDRYVRSQPDIARLAIV